MADESHVTLEFDVDEIWQAVDQGADEAVNSRVLARTCLGRKRKAGWSVEFGLATTRKRAINQAHAFIDQHRSTLKGGSPLLIPRMARDVIYVVGVTDLEQKNAQAVCKTISAISHHCRVLSPKVTRVTLEQARKVTLQQGDGAQ